MKKLYFLVVVLFVVGSVKGQVIDFPDANFKAKLLSDGVAKNLSNQPFLIDSNQNGQIEQSEALNVSSLYIGDSSDASFSTLTGLNYFQNLKYFNLTSNNIATIDLSMLYNLETVELQSLNSEASMLLNSLNVTGLANLKMLIVVGADFLQSIDLTDVTNLENYTVNSSNALTGTMNFNQNPNLQFVDLGVAPNTIVNLSGCSQLLSVIVAGGVESINLSGCTNIETLYLSNNMLTSLNIDDLTNLITLYVDSNSLNIIDTSSNPNLAALICNQNQLTSLNISNNSLLMALTCNQNLLTSLDVSNNPLLQGISCQENFISSLDFSNNPLIATIIAYSNQLTSVNLTNCNELNSLFLGNNLLTSLDISSIAKPVGGNIINNQLVSVFMKNGFEDSLILNGNPILEYICADEVEIPAIFGISSDVEINTYCNFTSGGEFYTINGTNIIDSNNNGCDENDISLPSLKFQITNGVNQTITVSDITGSYSISLQSGNYTITPILENLSYFNIYPSEIDVSLGAIASPLIQNICITPNGVYPDLEVTILPTTPARPGFDAEYKLIIKNKGNIQQSGLVSFAYNDAVLDYVIADPAFTTQAEGSLSWAFANLEPFETREINVTLNVNSPMETPAINGDDVLTYTATISSEATDELPLDNTFTLPQIVVNSFDPNDKTCLEGTSITPDMIGKYVHYMIRFENTGTFAAENIVVKDMIDTAKFDVSSLVTLNGSHPYVTRIIGNKVEFIFEGINLLFDDANNDGYVVFKIKTLPTLALGDSFSNTASIYFDYNHPIITEPAVTTFAALGTKDFEFNNYFTLYPNPTNGILNITTKQSIELQSISIYNVLGQMVVSVPNAKGLNSIDVSSLSMGNYFIKVVSDKGTANSKFIKQ